MGGLDTAWCEERDGMVVVHASDSAAGVPAEYDYLRALLGEQDRDWRVLGQRLERLETGGWADVVEIALAEGERREFRFDISAFSNLGRGGQTDGQNDDDDAPTIGELLGRKA